MTSESSPSTSTPSQHPARLVPIAPAGNVVPPQHNGASEEPHMPYTCVTCARRKVRCDKTGPPCGTCKKARQECQYQEPAPRKRKRKPVDDLQERLDRYEELLKQNNILPRNDQPSPALPSPAATTTNNTATPGSGGLRMPDDGKKPGKLFKAEGKTRYVNSNIWTNFGDDLHPSSDEEDVDIYRRSYLGLEPHRRTTQGGTADTPGLVDPVSAAFFAPAATVQNLLDIHPTYDVAMNLWKHFVQTVDPITRLLHRPTTLEMLQQASANPTSITKVQECLLFSIYHFAVVTVEEKECESLFGHPKHILQRRYHDATRQSLVACHFLRTTELSVLQAYLLFLLASRDEYDPHTFWIMTGIAVRIGQRMGLHRDGAQLGLSPFETQMRRRAFWQLLPLDGLSGQLSGTGIAMSSDTWDTKQPWNVNDEDIWPGMETQPVEKVGATDMIFCLARSEIGKFHQKTKPVLGDWGKLWEARDLPPIHEALRELENVMEEKYIRYCDISNPVHCLTMTLTRGAINGARLRIRLPRVKSEHATQEDRRELFELCLKVLEIISATHLNSLMARFDWHMRQFFQWDPLIWLLNEVCRSDSVVDPEVVWGRVEALYACRPELRLQRRSLDVALNRLVIRSWDGTCANRTTSMAEPKFIADLRALLAQRRENSRQNTETPSQRMDFFDTPQDAASDIPVYNYLNTNPLLPNNMLEDNNMLDVDWKFWEQLMQDPSLPSQSM